MGPNGAGHRRGVRGGGPLSRDAPAPLADPRHRPGLVYSPHGWAFLTPGSRVAASLYGAIEWLLARMTDRLVAVSLEERRVAIGRGLGDPERVRYIPYGISPEGFPTA